MTFISSSFWRTVSCAFLTAVMVHSVRAEAPANPHGIIATRNILYDDHKLSDGEMQGPQPEHIHVVPGDKVIVTVKFPGDANSPSNTDTWIETWTQHFKWTEKHKEGKDTVITTVHRDRVRSKQGRLGTQLKLNVDVVDVAGVDPKITKPVNTDTITFEVHKPADLIFWGVADASPPDFDKPDPRAQKDGAPVVTEQLPKCVLYVVTVEIIR